MRQQDLLRGTAAAGADPPEPHGSRARDRQGLLNKLRCLVSHPATGELLRRMARAKLDILSPRNPRPTPGSPRRRAADREPDPRAVPQRLVAAAYALAAPDGAGETGGTPRQAEEAPPALDIRA